MGLGSRTSQHEQAAVERWKECALVAASMPMHTGAASHTFKNCHALPCVSALRVLCRAPSAMQQHAHRTSTSPHRTANKTTGSARALRPSCKACLPGAGWRQGSRACQLSDPTLPYPRACRTPVSTSSQRASSRSASASPAPPPPPMGRRRSSALRQPGSCAVYASRNRWPLQAMPQGRESAAPWLWGVHPVVSAYDVWCLPEQQILLACMNNNVTG